MSGGDVLRQFAGRRCLVTGGLGFIGSNLAVALSRADAQVAVIDSLLPRLGGDRRNLAGSNIEVIVIADIADRSSVGAAIASAEYVFDLAGQVSHIDSMTDPLRDLDVNTRSHLAFLELLRELNPDATAVYTSTRQLYGRPQYLPVDESHPVQPVDVNGVCKFATEQLFMLYASCYDLRACVLRLSNVYGPRQRVQGEHQGFLPRFLGRALRGEPLTVFGDGAQKRDSLFVDDAVSAIALAALSCDAPGEIFNVGHSESLSVAEIAATIVDVVGSGTVEYRSWPDENRVVDIGSYATDFSKAKRMLGWAPTIPFRSGVQATVKFIRERPDWYL